MLLTTEIWIVLYNLFNAWYNSEPFDISELVRNMLFLNNVDISSYWYMPKILGIYVFVPLVSTVLKKIDTKTLVMPLIIASLYLYVVPTVDVVLAVYGHDSIYSKLDLSFSGGIYGVMVIFGYLFRRLKECENGGLRISRKVLVTVYTSMFLTGFILSVWIQLFAYSHGYKYNIWYDNIFLVIACLGLFGIFSEIKKVPLYVIIKRISKCSFGIYLIHYMIIKTLHRDLIIDHRYIKFIVMYIAGFGLSWIIVEIIGKFKKTSKVLLFMK